MTVFPKAFKTKLKIAAIQNIFIIMLHKCLVVMNGGFGFPLVPIVFLWYHIMKGRQWAVKLYYIGTILMGALTLLFIFTIALTIYRGMNLYWPIIAFVATADFTLSGIWLHRNLRVGHK